MDGKERGKKVLEFRIVLTPTSIFGITGSPRRAKYKTRIFLRLYSNNQTEKKKKLSWLRIKRYCIITRYSTSF